MIKYPEIGDLVIYVDEYGVEHNALLTTVWSRSPEETLATYENPEKYQIISNEFGFHIIGPHDKGATTIAWPSVNLVYVNSNKNMNDPYGRQIKRGSSICHKSNQSAPANFWYI